DRDIAAEIIGVRPLRTKLLAFGISSFYCGVAGAELVFLYFGSAETFAFDITLSFLVLFMVIIGGPGSILGSLLGAAFIVLVPLLVYRTGPFAPSGIPIANGFVDYFTLVNERDGGINGVKLTWEECETQYKTDLGVECYEKLKGKGPTGAALVNPYSTGITYQ